MSLRTVRSTFTFRLFAFLLVLISLLPIYGTAQNVNYTKSTADSNLRGSLQVDPSTLGMSFNLPMGGYGGRGVTLPISLTYSSKVWRMDHYLGQPGPSYYLNQIEAKYAEKSVAGWTSSTGAPYVEWTGSEQPYNSYPGDAICFTCEPPSDETPYYVDRVLLHLPDGSTHEMRRNDNVVDGNGLINGSGIYVAVDGSRVKFDGSTIFLPDGSWYWLTAPNGVQYIDRNGNTLTYNTTTNQWTDTMGRVIPAIPLNNSAVGDLNYFIPGVGGVNQKFILRWKRLGDAGVLTTAQALRFKGRYNYNWTAQTISPYLFSGNLADRMVDSGIPGYEHNPIVLSEIVLPNGLSYKFTYNVWGEVDKVALPSGGYERFEYAAVPSVSDVGVPYNEGNRGAIKHWISATGNAVDEVQWTYASTGTVTTVTNPSGSRAERTLIAASINTHFGFEDARTGKATEERTYNASNQLIRRTLVDWTQDGNLPGGHSEAKRNPRPTKKVEVLLDTAGNALAAMTIPTYDADLNEIKSEQYDYTQVSLSTGQTGAITAFTAGTLLRTEETTYLVNDTTISQSIRDAYRARNMLGLPSKKLIKNGSGVVVAAMEYKYDEAAYAPLTYASVTGWTNPATTYLGNVTTVRAWDNNGNQAWVNWTTGTWIETHTQYDQCGNVRKSWDGKGNLAQVEYTDAFSDSINRNTYAYPTKTTSPVPDPTGTFGTNTSLIAQSKYDFSTGKVTWVQDANNQVATTEYEQPYSPVVNNCCNSLNRVTRVVRPTGGGETTYEYSDTVGNMWVKTRTKRDASNWVESAVYLDKLGRTYLSATSEGGNSWLVSETKYDNQGRAHQASNPYRVTGAANAGAVPAAAAGTSGKQWTTSTFDALNRVLTVTTPDNAVVTTSYEVNKVTVTDQAGKQRRSESDALGRLSKVVEAPNAENYTTTYSYDALGNLTGVNQSGQTRTFGYDSLKRLKSANNPESGTTMYAYDNNSNLLTRTDARPLTTTYTYDNLNRNTTVRYSSYPDGTAAVDRFYDNATLGKDKFFYAVSYNTETNGTLTYNYDQINSYDAVGRPLSKSQNFLVNQGGYQWKPYTTSVTYDLSGNVTSQTYPSGRTVNYAYDTAGRTTSFTGNLGDGTSRNYSTGMAYDAAGHLTKETFGTTTPLYQRLNYNVRQQLYAVRVGTDSGTTYDNNPQGAYTSQATSWDRGLLVWHYSANDYTTWGTSGTTNNGNVLRTHHYISGGVNYQDAYTYDGLNRILQDTGSGSASYTQGFTYDAWGNRTINQAATSQIPDINRKAYTVNTTTNRLGVPSGQTGAMTYDAVGNLITDTYTETNPAKQGAMTYDANNHMTSAVNGSHKYRYNADGKRVKRIIASGGEFWMVYGIGGGVVAEYNATSSIPAQTAPSKEYGYRGGQMLVIAEGSNPKWLIQDHLGSTRMEIGLSGAANVVTRHDYLPFGEELGGSLRSGNGYGVATNTKQKFTGYERDDETSLDFAQARYYASVQGRYASVDPDGVGASPDEPQSWNGYAYVGNRPTTTTDPSGLLWAYNSQTGDLQWFKSEAEFDAAYAADQNWKKVDGTYFIVTRSGTVNGKYLRAGHAYYLDPNGNAIDQYDPVRDFAYQMGQRASATQQAILLFAGGGAAIGGLGGVAAAYGGVSLYAGYITLRLAPITATALSVADKLNRYLLNPDHPVGGPKARWFQQALGFTRANMAELAKQIVFDQSKAVVTGVTEFGTKYNQVIAIQGANGKVIDVTFAWIKGADGVARLVTAIPTKN